MNLKLDRMGIFLVLRTSWTPQPVERGSKSELLHIKLDMLKSSRRLGENYQLESDQQHGIEDLNAKLIRTD